MIACFYSPLTSSTATLEFYANMASKAPEMTETNRELQSVEREHTSNADEKNEVTSNANHLEKAETGSDRSGNLVYTDEDEEPEIHLRTWIAMASMILLLCVQNLSLQGPPAVVSDAATRTCF